MQVIATIDWWTIGGYGLAVVLCAVVAVPILLGIFYTKEFQRLFESAPPLQAQLVDPAPDDDPVELTTSTGRRLVGSLFRHRGGERRGLIIFCHEFTGNRWLFQPYVDFIRDDGFDVFTFDFSNHGQSDAIDGYQPLQWVTEHEVADVDSAIEYVTSQQIASFEEIGLFGVSKGGGAAIVAAARNPRIQAVITDGAFPTHSIVTIYVERWVHLVVAFGGLLRMLPPWVHAGITRMELARIQRRRHCRYPHMEKSFRSLTRRPWFLIHGNRDNYVRTEVIEAIFNGNGQPEQFWKVNGAKHNQSIQVAQHEYHDKVRSFFLTHLNPSNM
ncbi:Alpha/beta hydrolase family protein [Symmachiella macrocystis]|uniref:Alpha/beta hydrolase family protein n=1 Tax=Symmachiella macrocystis TaxID=2527985 RepID=A0A5C6BNN8_9PLAN|nr:Alpha/beta hydrolase family protein [Symmachiella macrocystis]